MIDRYLYFRRQTREVNPFLDELSQHLEQGEISVAQELARRQGGVEGRVAASGLECINRDRAVLEERLAGARVAERVRMERYLPFLGTLGNNAPFIGLFGTVLGIIRAFHDLAISQVGGPSVVMRGISEALLATAIGLFVAIPAVIAYNIFQGKVKRVAGNLERISRLIMNFSESTGKGESAP
jgi:biopolymer transport protein ExbB